ncbi:MFS transporter [Ileibacterium valens]|uniref:MFS transporter n=1 Tax=Ileibacterium valens TaxID=1862668 RepID=UPI00259B79FF|nr:MFS transporter [Ileibacterium valens]
MTLSYTSVDELRMKLPASKKNLIFIGCLFMMLSLAAFGLSLSTIQQPLLNEMGQPGMFSLVTVLTSIAMCLMTPVGGRISDMIGGRQVILIFGMLTLVLSIVLGFCTSFIPFVIVRILCAMATGAFVSTPFLLVREIYENNQVPSRMGILTAALSAGSLIGSFGAGFFADHQMMFLAIVFPSIFLMIGIPLIYMNLPKLPTHSSKFDFLGFLLLSAALTTLFLALNYAGQLTFHNPLIWAGIISGIVFFVLFIFVEKKKETPLINMDLFSNKLFSLVLLIAFLSFCYLIAMNAYAPLAVQELMNGTAAESGSLQIPRAIITILLPGLVGTWVVKKQGRMWQALAIASILIFIPFLGMVFIGPNMPVWFVMVLLALNGIGDCFRSVSITPAAQAQLRPDQLGIGTSLLSFATSLASVFASSVYGLVYDGLSQATPGLQGQIEGLDTVFLIAAGTGLISFLLVVSVYRPWINKQREEQEKAHVEASAAK